MKYYNNSLIRTVLHFSLRIDTDQAGLDVVTRLEEAFGAQFHEERTHGICMTEMYLMGMVIRFIPWRGIGLRKVYQLVAYTQLPTTYVGEEELPSICLNEAVIDLLQAKGAGSWHAPSNEELDAEDSEEVDRMMEEDP